MSLPKKRKGKLYPRVSVIIPTYNGSETITRAILSAKSGGAYEVIVIDDASTDRTPLIASKHADIVFTYPHNSGGPNRGRNLGAGLAKGDYLCFLDQDDYFLGNFMELPRAMYQAGVGVGYGIRRYPNNFGYAADLRNVLAKEYRKIPFIGDIVVRTDAFVEFEQEVGALDYDWLVKTFRYAAEHGCIRRGKRVVRDRVGLSLSPAYRYADYHASLQTLLGLYWEYPKEVTKGIHRTVASRGKYLYKLGEGQEARKYFAAAPGLKNRLYEITTYFPWLMRLVCRLFGVFGPRGASSPLSHTGSAAVAIDVAERHSHEAAGPAGT